ncbi:flagellar biosynthetic protein FliO [Kaistia nematophila]|uniref:Flagellar biosynthetic protein FliO n=1 Tax=Kaistia nematophila TaxID=2994654 RepID=A0A9X3ILB5_9HYPH|nr:flagellar biosynthetic protein FliO [Kaistia nematophila]MCX5569376.1 flagellar biosynthetic protein FliO [Kaistia nematophila]
MHDYLAPMFGDTGATVAQFVITLVVILLAILLVFWLIRLFTNGRLGAGPARGRQPRLAVLDALPIDQRRRLILVRRDNVEHLILIGGPSDVVVEPGIQRAQQPARRLEPIRQEPPRPEPIPARPEPMQGRPATQNLRPVPQEAAGRPQEPRRPEPAQQAEIQSFEAPVAAEASVRRPEPIQEPVYEEAQPFVEERVAEAEFVSVAEPEPSLEPAPPQPPVQPAAPQAQRPAPRPAPAPEPRNGRGFPSFLSGNRPRHTPTTVDIPPESMPAPRPVTPQAPAEPIEGRSTGQRPRPYDPRPLLGSQQTPVAPAAPSAPAAPRRPVAPPPVVAPEPDPFAGVDDEAERLARFEPIFDLGPETASADDAHLYATPARAPSVEPPQPIDAPVEIAEDFIDAPEPSAPAESEASSSVGDLEKEMARLLGEISNARKS